MSEECNTEQDAQIMTNFNRIFGNPKTIKNTCGKGTCVKIEDEV